MSDHESPIYIFRADLDREREETKVIMKRWDLEDRLHLRYRIPLGIAAILAAWWVVGA